MLLPIYRQYYVV